MKKFIKKLKAKIRNYIKETIKYINFKIVVPVAYKYY